MDLELDEKCSICYDCTKYDDCPNRRDDIGEDECPDYEEARWCLTPKGIFCTIIHDMGWDELCGKQSELAWEVYEHRAPENALDKETFASVITDFGWCDENDRLINVAFELFVSRMRNLGYLGDGKDKAK
jgi:hypothetical protein